jgi:hypothetical protein
MTPLHRPAPELPTSRPLPLATDRPTDILTDTAKGALLVALQLPAWVAKTTFQTPS